MAVVRVVLLVLFFSYPFGIDGAVLVLVAIVITVSIFFVVGHLPIVYPPCGAVDGIDRGGVGVGVWTVCWGW